MPLLLTIIVASFIESLVAFVGGLLAIAKAEKIFRAAHFVVSFAVGALLGVAFLELIPEALEHGGEVGTIAPFLLAGVIIFFILEKFLFWYHCHDKQCQAHTYTYLILWGDFLHNFIDGVIIALAFMADVKLGIMTSIAVIFHEIPQEISDFGILIHGGFAKSKALFYNYIVALSVVPGAILTYFLRSYLEPFIPMALALIAGNFIYIAIADLMPELHEASTLRHSMAQILLIIAGAIVVMLPEFLLG